jgi:clan AA aspartic protease
VEAIIDTGFDGWLTLPPSLVSALALRWLMQGQVMLGDGRTQPCDLYSAVVIWDGQPLRVMLDQADTEPLVGMMLMDGYELNVEVMDGGVVTLKRI